MERLGPRVALLGGGDCEMDAFATRLMSYLVTCHMPKQAGEGVSGRALADIREALGSIPRAENK